LGILSFSAGARKLEILVSWCTAWWYKACR